MIIRALNHYQQKFPGKIRKRGVPFKRTAMIQLSGYLTSEIAATG